ncbi:MAG: GNAT family N-acetyltransferase [Corynebacterium sp.]|nr:GNAT family N-acetyltransferase [Corynebacterium sp.]
MKFLRFPTDSPDTPETARYLEFLENAPWGAAKFMRKALLSGSFAERFGKTGELYFVLDDASPDTPDNKLPIMGFGAHVEQDFFPIPEFNRFLAFVYVAPNYRGQHLSTQIIEFLENRVRELEEDEVHILTQHSGLYEKMGYTHVRTVDDGVHDEAHVYVKDLATRAAG